MRLNLAEEDSRPAGLSLAERGLERQQLRVSRVQIGGLDETNRRLATVHSDSRSSVANSVSTLTLPHSAG